MIETPAKKKLLFVDDEPNILSGLRRLLRTHRHQWDMTFLSSPEQALALLEEQHFDVLITDLRMPNTNGIQLLEQVKQKHPDVIRFILSGHGDTDMMIQSVSVAHQFMSKPCNAEILQSAIERALSLSALFQSENLKAIVQDATTLPTLPELYQELMTLLQSPNSSAEKVAAVIAKDISISAKVLQLVNSAFFGLSRQVDSIQQAVMLLGAETINSIALATQVFFEFEEEDVSRFKVRDIYAHSIATGACASKIAGAVTGDKKAKEKAMLAGIVHDLGKLVLIQRRYSEWQNLFINRDPDIPFHEQERQRLGTTHAEIGAYIIGLWGITSPIVEAVAYHHRPSELEHAGEFSTLTALHIANCLQQQAGSAPPPIDCQLDEAYLSSLGLLDRIDEFSQLIPTSET